jgi:hypothetical protein
VITKEYSTTNGDSSTRIGALSATKMSFLMVNGGLIMVNSGFIMVISENLMISYGVAKNKHVGFDLNTKMQMKRMKERKLRI